MVWGAQLVMAVAAEGPQELQHQAWPCLHHQESKAAVDIHQAPNIGQRLGYRGLKVLPV